MNLSEMSDWDFSKAWVELSDAERAAIPVEDRKHYFERYRALTSYMDHPELRLGREHKGNGDTPDEPPMAEPPIESSALESCVINWTQVVGEPPAFDWIMPHWLSWHPTLIAGRGGMGKSLLIQRIGTQLACGLPTFCAASRSVNVLYWACEDDANELWRRENTICRQLGISFTALSGLHTDARLGFENTLMESVYGRLMFTPLIELLRQQLNDYAIDVLCLDNIGHVFGGNENARHDVTRFVNGINGLVRGRPFCPIFLGHTAKVAGSEFSGSSAWENSVRMRWYFDDRLPDAKADPEAAPDPDYRVLSKRKTNYTIKDFITLRYVDGVFLPDVQAGGDPGVIAGIRNRLAREAVIAAMAKLAEVGIYGSRRVGRNYLPLVILENHLAEGFTKAELGAAMRALIMSKTIAECVVAKNTARHAIIGLKTAVSV
jgi:hypothetical protein